MPNEGEVANQNENQQQTLVSAKSQIVNVELQMHSNAKLQNTNNVHSNSENNTHEGNEGLPNGDMHEDLEVERKNMETRKERVLEKYVRRHHLVDQIIGNKEIKMMTSMML